MSNPIKTEHDVGGEPTKVQLTEAQTSELGDRWIDEAIKAKTIEEARTIYWQYATVLENQDSNHASFQRSLMRGCQVFLIEPEIHFVNLRRQACEELATELGLDPNDALITRIPWSAASRAARDAIDNHYKRSGNRDIFEIDDPVKALAEIKALLRPALTGEGKPMTGNLPKVAVAQRDAPVA